MGSQPEVGSPLFPGVSPCCVGGVGRQASRYRDERQGCPVRGRKRSIGVNGPRSFRTMRSVPDEAGHLLSSFLSSLGHLFYPLPCFVPFSCFPRYRWPAADRARFRLSLPFLFHFSPFPSISLYKISLLFFLISPMVSFLSPLEKTEVPIFRSLRETPVRLCEARSCPSVPLFTSLRFQSPAISSVWPWGHCSIVHPRGVSILSTPVCFCEALLKTVEDLGDDGMTSIWGAKIPL